jgi:hypothetical protein
MVALKAILLIHCPVSFILFVLFEKNASFVECGQQWSERDSRGLFLLLSPGHLLPTADLWGLPTNSGHQDSLFTAQICRRCRVAESPEASVLGILGAASVAAR